MGPTDVFSSTPGRVLTAGTAVAVVLLVGFLAGDVATADLLLAGSLGGLAVLVVWAVLGRPSVEVSDGTVVLQNVLRTVTVPWPTLVGTEVGWSLVVRTTAGRWTAWAAPRASGTARALRRGRGTEPAGATRAGADGERRHHPGTAEAAAAAIDERLAALRWAGHLDDAERMVAEHGLRPTVRWHGTTIACGLGLVLLAVATRVA